MNNFKYKEISEITHQNGGIITNKILSKKGINHFYLFNLVMQGKFIKVDKGIYSLASNPNIDELFLLQQRYPKIIYSFYTAANLHRLGENIPLKNDITIPQGHTTRVFDKSKYRIHTDIQKIHGMGVVLVKTMYGNPIACYDARRTVCDFIKCRNKIEPETFQKVMKDYFSKPNNDPIMLLQYAKRLRIANKVRDLMEVLGE